MPQAKITVNAVPGSNTDLPINTVVALNNQNTGGELTYAWNILDQPPGTTDVLSSVNTQNPTFTPKKEGSYLLRLIVNQGDPDQQENRVIVGVRQLKTRERIPAAGETTEADAADGWATAYNSILRRDDALLSDPGVIVGVNSSGGTLTRGQVVRCTATEVLKNTLPGQESVPGFTLATSSTLGEVDELLCIVEGTPTGGTSVPGVGIPENRIMKVRYIGRFAGAVPASGVPAVGDTIFVNDSGLPDTAAGTVRRRIGSAATAGNPFDLWFDGVGGAEIDLTPIDRRYVVYGPLGALPNGFRVDGANASGSIGGVPYTIKAGDVGTAAFQLRRFSNVGAHIQEWATEAGTVLAFVGNDGTLTEGQGIHMLTANIDWTGSGFINGNGGSVKISSEGSASDVATMFRVASETFFVVSNNDFGGGTNGAIWVASGDNSVHVGGLSTGTNLFLQSNNADQWEVDSSGNLIAVGAPDAQLIRQIKDPLLADDAATKNYVDNARRANYAQNSGLHLWQRTKTKVGGLVTGLGTARDKIADRWWVYAHGQTVAGTMQFTHSRVAAASGGVSAYAMRNEVTTITGGAGYDTRIVHEVDREALKELRGKKVSIAFRMKKGSAFTGSVVVQVIASNDADAFTAYDSYGTPTTVLNETFTPTTSAVLYSTTSPSTDVVVPTNTTTMAIVFKLSTTSNGNAVATANNYIDTTEVMLTAARPVPAFSYFGGSIQTDDHACFEYVEKSYNIDTDTGANVNSFEDGGEGGRVYGTAGGTDARIAPVKMQVRKREFSGHSPAVSTWGASGAAGDVDVAGVGNVAVDTADCSDTYVVVTTTATHNVGSGVFFFWLVDTDIF